MEAFTKRRPCAPSGFFAVEAAGLNWLDVPGGVRVARVLSVERDSISVERINPAAASKAAAVDFGHRLTATHDAGATAFGAPPDGWDGGGFIGETSLSLRPDQSWGHFYAEQRVLPYARLAARGRALDEPGLRRIEALAERLADGEFDDDAPPARIHGDLWAGNVMFDATGAVLIDPAAHGGHRITDLAMLALFGFPHLGEVLASYEQASPWLPPRWRELIGLHQLHPLLVHAVLFGGSYGEQAVAVSNRY